MKRFRIREKVISKGWTYVTASSEEEAIKLLEDGYGDFVEETHQFYDTKWETWEEV